MNEFNVGDKVYLECEVKEKNRSDNIYLLKYENQEETAAWMNRYFTTAWVKDDALHTPDELYNKGLNDAWELAKKIVESPSNGGYTPNELVEIFGSVNKPVLDAYTPQEAIAKVKEYEIKVGDVVTAKGCTIESIVTKIDEHIIDRLFKDGSVNGYAIREDLMKTGKHFDSIDEFMRSADD